MLEKDKAYTVFKNNILCTVRVRYSFIYQRDRGTKLILKATMKFHHQLKNMEKASNSYQPVLLASFPIPYIQGISQTCTGERSVPGASVRNSAHGKGHEEGALAYAKV